MKILIYKEKTQNVSKVLSVDSRKRYVRVTLQTTANTFGNGCNKLKSRSRRNLEQIKLRNACHPPVGPEASVFPFPTKSVRQIGCEIVSLTLTVSVNKICNSFNLSAIDTRRSCPSVCHTKLQYSMLNSAMFSDARLPLRNSPLQEFNNTAVK